MLLRPDKSQVLPMFFLYQLLSPVVFEAQISPRITGSAAPHLNIGDLRRFTFLLPPLAKQREIVRLLDGARSLTTRLHTLQNETRAELDALIPSVLDRAFSGTLFDHFGIEAARPAEAS
jgi:type I restriction enzyme S subunit